MPRNIQPESSMSKDAESIRHVDEPNHSLVSGIASTLDVPINRVRTTDSTHVRGAVPSQSRQESLPSLPSDSQRPSADSSKPHPHPVRVSDDLAKSQTSIERVPSKTTRSDRPNPLLRSKSSMPQEVSGLVHSTTPPRVTHPQTVSPPDREVSKPDARAGSFPTVAAATTRIEERTPSLGPKTPRIGVLRGSTLPAATTHVDEPSTLIVSATRNLPMSNTSLEEAPSKAAPSVQPDPPLHSRPTNSKEAIGGVRSTAPAPSGITPSVPPLDRTASKFNAPKDRALPTDTTRVGRAGPTLSPKAPVVERQRDGSLPPTEPGKPRPLPVEVSRDLPRPGTSIKTVPSAPESDMPPPSRAPHGKLTIPQESTQESTMASRSTEPSRATQQAPPPNREVSKPDARVGDSGSITVTAKTDERALASPGPKTSRIGLPRDSSLSTTSTRVDEPPTLSVSPSRNLPMSEASIKEVSSKATTSVQSNPPPHGRSTISEEVIGGIRSAAPPEGFKPVSPPLDRVVSKLNPSKDRAPSTDITRVDREMPSPSPKPSMAGLRSNSSLPLAESSKPQPLPVEVIRDFPIPGASVNRAPSMRPTLPRSDKPTTFQVLRNESTKGEEAILMFHHAEPSTVNHSAPAVTRTTTLVTPARGFMLSHEHTDNDFVTQPVFSNNIVPSETNIQRPDPSLSAIKDSLASLRKDTALARRISYIPSLAARLLQALPIQDDVTLHREKQDGIDNIRKIASLVSEVGTKCINEKLEMNDLPRGLHAIFRSLETELNKDEKDFGKTLETLQAFQAVLAFDPRFVRFAERVEVEFTNVHTRYDQDQTPLHVASQLGQVQVMESLIIHGANLNLENDYKETPLFLAVRSGNTAATQLLLNRGVEVDHQDWEKRTPLQRASENGHHTVARLLLKSGANSNAKNVYGWSALHLASRGGKKEVVEELLRSGANINVLNDSGRTPLHMASQQGHAEVVKLLLSKHATTDIQEARGETALHLAAYYGHFRVAQHLIERGADVRIPSHRNRMALDLAKSEGHRDLVRLLEAEIKIK